MTTTRRRAGPLDPTRLYSGDNGRLFCGEMRCAGMTAHATGRDLSGQRVVAMDDDEARGFLRLVGRGPTCEGCGRAHPAASGGGA